MTLIKCPEARETLGPCARVGTHHGRALLEDQFSFSDVPCGNENPPWKPSLNDPQDIVSSKALTQVASDVHFEGVTLPVTVLVDGFVSVAHSHVTRFTNLDFIIRQADETPGAGLLWYLTHFNFSPVIQCFDFGRQNLERHVEIRFDQ